MLVLTIFFFFILNLIQNFYLNALSSSPPFFHTCTSYMSEVHVLNKNGWSTFQEFTVLTRNHLF